MLSFTEYLLGLMITPFGFISGYLFLGEEIGHGGRYYWSTGEVVGAKVQVVLLLRRNGFAGSLVDLGYEKANHYLAPFGRGAGRVQKVRPRRITTDH